MIELSQSFTFEAAHYLPQADEAHNKRIHGHSFLVEVVIVGDTDPQTGLLMNLEDLEKLCHQKIHAYLDHQLLNEIEGLAYPTLENISKWIWNRLEGDLPFLDAVIIYRKTCGQKCVYRANQIPRIK